MSVCVTAKVTPLGNTLVLGASHWFFLPSCFPGELPEGAGPPGRRSSQEAVGAGRSPPTVPGDQGPGGEPQLQVGGVIVGVVNVGGCGQCGVCVHGTLLFVLQQCQ